jgi:hypothetical protein
VEVLGGEEGLSSNPEPCKLEVDVPGDGGRASISISGVSLSGLDIVNPARCADEESHSSSSSIAKTPFIAPSLCPVEKRVRCRVGGE